MAHIYMQFDFGADEEKAQQAWHKLEGWKQAFRLGEKLIFKFDREEAEGEVESDDSEKAKSKRKKAKEESETGGTVKLILRLGFSGHEKITEQRWVDRIPSEEPFSSSSPQVIKQSQPEFAGVAERFENLDRAQGAAGGGREHPG
ncbi:MAG TPA: hypothetical protein VN982_15380 [Candidatus Dormibacteraeota bacterium]|nr:hypothetical protein [Candidatus Dormibacteraeota bacterium]